MANIKEISQRDLDSTLVLKVEDPKYLPEVMGLFKDYEFKIPPEKRILNENCCYLWVNSKESGKYVYMYYNPDEFGLEGDDPTDKDELYFLTYPKNALRLVHYLEYRAFDKKE